MFKNGFHPLLGECYINIRQILIHCSKINLTHDRGNEGYINDNIMRGREDDIMRGREDDIMRGREDVIMRGREDDVWTVTNHRGKLTSLTDFCIVQNMLKNIKIYLSVELC